MKTAKPHLSSATVPCRLSSASRQHFSDADPSSSIHLRTDFVLTLKRPNMDGSDGKRERGNNMSTIQLPANSASASSETQFSGPRTEAKLQDLIPIAMVIAAGCETCAEKMVARALEEGSSWQDVDKTLRIVASMQKMDCFTSAVGPEVVARMDKPLCAGRKILQQAMVLAPR